MMGKRVVVPNVVSHGQGGKTRGKGSSRSCPSFLDVVFPTEFESVVFQAELSGLQDEVCLSVIEFEISG